MQLIREYSMHEHQVAFYAEKLCISSRYLHKITVRHLDGKKPKQLIDEQLVAEIKVLLNEPRLSVTEIAEQLHFPDQSYLTLSLKRIRVSLQKSFGRSRISDEAESVHSSPLL